MVALFFLLLAVAALGYGAVLMSFSGPVPKEQREVPVREV
jgi:hypothetical protein